MRRGLLSDYFDGVAVKRLSAVEADILCSNQHEFNSSKQLTSLLGSPDRAQYRTIFIWIGGEQEALSEEGFLTWYQSRKPPRREHRLYFPNNAVCETAAAGDVLFIARRTDNTLMAIIVPGGSTIHNQLVWLFGLEEQPALEFESLEISKDNAAELDFTARYILDELGIEVEEPEVDRLDALIAKFGLVFPPSRVLSELARASLPQVSAADDPDRVLMAWIDREEQLFRRLERHVVADRIKNGFHSDEGTDVDGFMGFSKSVQNRRMKHAGLALEHHLEAVFSAHRVHFDRDGETENRNKPDFLFPSQEEYRDPSFPAARLTMLGAKSTLKDRWHQVLSEAERITEKHLLTLEPGISENQTDEMRAKQLQLVLPQSLHSTYREIQRGWLMTLGNFVELVKERQRSG
ncbi:type II restriction endonuclease [Mesorhizobium sp. B2-4-6]|uniref:type II restriction endonuclease n=1 Tax=Mesorhizobium sp. B2-4-6 TaxID=2589943 RepID=UPI0011279003|nr:type II restriction endonuclease [Mesorhizobium sp. B2-4-6]TPL38890.1 restriction endonuclease [Mesorhizobium sp. B2-4-6]